MRLSSDSMCEVYTDASRDEDVIGIAYVSEDDRGSRWIVGEYSSMEAEFLAVNEALRCCSDADVIYLHIDCQPLIRKIVEQDHDPWTDYFETFNWLSSKYEAVSIEYVPREENAKANRMAREAFWEGKDFYRSDD